MIHCANATDILPDYWHKHSNKHNLPSCISRNILVTIGNPVGVWGLYFYTHPALRTGLSLGLPFGQVCRNNAVLRRKVPVLMCCLNATKARRATLWIAPGETGGKECIQPPTPKGVALTATSNWLTEVIVT